MRRARGPDDDKATKRERRNQGRNTVNHKPKRAAAIAAAVILTVTGVTAHAAEIRVLSTQATEEAYRELVPEFEKATGHKVATTSPGPSTPTSGWRLARATTF